MVDPHEHYLAEKVATASPAQLTAMLYDACAGGVLAAQRHVATGDWAAADRGLRRSMDVLLELRVTLDESAGPLARDLGDLYTWAWQRLLHATSRRDPAGLDDALAVVAPLRDAWRTACLGGTTTAPSPRDAVAAAYAA